MAIASTTHYITIYQPNHAKPVGIVEFQISRGQTKIRNLKWIKDLLQLAQSNKMGTDIKYFGLHGYLSKIDDLTKLPRTNQGNIELAYIPRKLTQKEILDYLVPNFTH